MKKVSLLMIALLATVVAFATLSGKQFDSPLTMLNKAEVVKAQKSALLVKALDRKAQPAYKKVVRKATDELVTPPAEATVVTYYTIGGVFYAGTDDGWADATSNMPSVNVVIDGTDMYIQGLAYWFKEGWIKGTIDGATVTFASGQFVGTDDYGSEYIVGSADGQDVADIVFAYDSEAGTLTATTSYVIESGAADAVSPYCYWYSPVFSLTEPVGPSVVEVPEGLEPADYVIVYTDYDGDDGSATVKVGFDGSDVYFQGLNSYLPDAWVKGTLENGVVTLAGGQYFGAYGQYEMFLQANDYEFTFDAETEQLAGEGLLYTYTGNQYADYYVDPVLKKPVDKAAMPANPAITSLKNGNYGYYFNFNIPLIDTERDVLMASKLSYMIYTDVEGEIAPLTFTPATHESLTEDMTEIPYGFTDDWDFYASTIYLNDLFSSDWNKIGIKAIYRGGDELNETEIQWYDIKPYAKVDVTFDFNAMEVATSSQTSTDGDITEPLVLSEDDVTLTVSPSTTQTANRFWGTGAGPQLRVYSGTLTFEVPEGKLITSIEFNYGKWNDDNAADSGELANDADAKVATWTGEAQEVVITIAANSQINSIVVTVAELDPELVVLPEGLETEAWTIDGTFADSYGGDNIVRATEVAIDGNDIYVKGIPFYFEEAWMKGTIEEGIATFPSGQFVGEDEYGREFMVGSDDGETICDIQFEYDAEAKTLTQKTQLIVENADTPSEIAPYGYWADMLIYAGEPVIIDPIEAPEGLETESYLFSATELVVEQPEEEGGEETITSEEYSHQMQVGFDGNDVYFKGISDETIDMWLKGTLSEDGKTVTIPVNQYLGDYTVLWYTFSYYFTAVDAEDNMTDIVLNYDAENNKFTTDQTLVLHDGKRNLGEPYQVFYDVEITKIHEVAAVPADPSVDEVKFETTYPSAYFIIPAEDVDGNPLLTSKLYYTIWVEEDGVEKPLTLVADPDAYSKLEEDMTEIPYDFTDNYDIYRGGSHVYFNPVDVVENWTKVGIQSIYYGGGECNKSNIVWSDNTVTGIADVTTSTDNNTVVFDLQGRVVNASAKGLLIKQTRQANGTMKTVKVIRK